MDIGFRQRPLWLLPLLLILTAQAFASLSRFGTDRPCHALLDDRPLVNGRHPLHLYHGHLGAVSRAERGTSCCYDTAFAAGYPKTPLFDPGSRTAELCLLAVGGGWRPAAYKVGVALAVWLVPAILALAARQVGLSPMSACLAAALGLPLTCSGPARRLMVEGDLDLWLGGLLVLAHLSALVGFHRRASAFDWLVLVGSAALGWFVSPPWFALALVPLAFFQLSVLCRHELGWHLAVALALAGAVAVNLDWLADWQRHWWVRLPLMADATARPPSAISLAEVWDAPCWGAPGERLLTAGLLGLGVVGIIALAGGRRSATAAALGAGLFACTAGAASEWFWPDLRPLAPVRLLVLAPWFAVVPALFALGATRRALGIVGIPLLGLMLVAAGAGIGLAWPTGRGPDFEVGLCPDRQRLARELRDLTAPDARILWEDRPESADARWACLLPTLTGRDFLGGLDPVGEIEHGYARMTPEGLAGRPLSSWSDEDLTRFCERYNVGWVVCWSPASVERWRRYAPARPVAALRDGESGTLFAIDRPHSMVLKGRAEVVTADRRRVVLRGVEPEDGLLVLSLHWQPGWRVTPGSAEPERHPDPFDPVPLLRLRLTGPVACLTLVWDNP